MLDQGQDLVDVGSPAGILPQRAPPAGAIVEIFIAPHMDDLIERAEFGQVIAYGTGKVLQLYGQPLRRVEREVRVRFPGKKCVGSVFDDHRVGPMERTREWSAVYICRSALP